jgi:hypothetical protein
VSFYFQYIVPDRDTAVFRAGLVAAFATVIMFGSPLASLVCSKNTHFEELKLIEILARCCSKTKYRSTFITLMLCEFYRTD